MRYLGIDYGEKRVGLAISDETVSFAMPYSVIPNDKNLISTVSKICKEKEVGAVVVGESKNFEGGDNPIMVQIKKFVHELEKKTGLQIFMEQEFLTSAESERIQGKNEMNDASAAAIILRSFIERKQNQRKQS